MNILGTLGQLHDVLGVVVIRARLSRVALIAEQWVEEGELFRSVVVVVGVIEIVPLLIDYPKVVVWTHWPQGSDSVQVCIRIQPLVVQGPRGYRLRALLTRLRLVETRTLLLRAMMRPVVVAGR